MLGFATLNPTYKYFSFCDGNPSQFHAADGSGYAFWAEQVIALNKLNPQVAARLVRTLDT